MANIEITRPIAALLTPNDLAKIGMAGMIRPKPNATKNETAVITVTSRGKSVNGELNRLMA